MEILGYVLLGVAGVALGLVGGGGAILTVPILTYLFGVPAVAATGYSLGVVAVASLVGGVSAWRAGQVDLRTALWFAGPSMLAAAATRRWLIPALPESIGPLSRDGFIMVCFGLTMLAVARSMIQSRRDEPDGAVRLPLVVVLGFVLGGLASFLGAGGGFLIVPALTLFAAMPMKRAVGASLVVIALQSAAGFAMDAWRAETMPWAFLGGCVLAVLGGLTIGMRLGVRVPGPKLKPLFGWLVLVVGVAILGLELAAGRMG